MANWSDPRTGTASLAAAAGARTEAYDAGLRSYMLAVYNYMASGVLLSGIVALGVASSATLMEAIYGSPLRLVVMFAPLGFVLAMNYGFRRWSTATLQALFWAFSVVMGVSLASIFAVYTSGSIAGAFFAAAGGFAGLSLYGYVTNRNLTALGSFMVVGLVGLLVAMLVNVFLHSGPLSLVISLVGVVVFAGLTAYDTQRTKSMYSYVAGSPSEGRVVIMAALNLYLDFVNMFLFLLRIFGSRR